MAAGEGSPTVPDIKDQLGRMLAAPRFRAAQNQSDFLALVVERMLQGKKTTGQIIAKELFGEKFMKLESTDVRVTATNLRKTIKKYYDAEGAGDLVLIRLPDPPRDRSIKLPEGEAYTPQCSYNPIHEAMKEVKLGEYHCARGTEGDYMQALEHFTSAVKMAPNDARIYVGAAEALLGSYFWHVNQDEATRISEEDDILSAAKLLDHAHNRAPGFWRIHAVGGVMLTQNGDFAAAQASFDTALKLDRESTEAYPGYFGFLYGLGKKSEAVRLAKKLLDNQPDNILAHVTYAKYLIGAGKLSEAEQVLENALKMDNGCSGVHLWLALLRVSQRRADDAIRHVFYLTLHLDPATLNTVEALVKDSISKWPQTLRSGTAKRFQSGGDLESPERLFDKIKPFSGI